VTYRELVEAAEEVRYRVACSGSRTVSADTVEELAKVVRDLAAKLEEYEVEIPNH